MLPEFAALQMDSHSDTRGSHGELIYIIPLHLLQLHMCHMNDPVQQICPVLCSEDHACQGSAFDFKLLCASLVYPPECRQYSIATSHYKLGGTFCDLILLKSILNHQAYLDVFWQQSPYQPYVSMGGNKAKLIVTVSSFFFLPSIHFT